MSVCACTWCVTGTKTEESPGQQTCSSKRKVIKVSQKRLCTTQTSVTGIQSDSPLVLSSFEGKEAKLLNQHQHCQYLLSSPFKRRPNSDNGQPQVYPERDYVSKRYLTFSFWFTEKVPVDRLTYQTAKSEGHIWLCESVYRKGGVSDQVIVWKAVEAQACLTSRSQLYFKLRDTILPL